MKSRLLIRKPCGFVLRPLSLALSFAFASGYTCSPVWAQETTAEPVNVDVTATRYDADAVVVGKELAIQKAANVDTATLMTNVSGVGFQVGGAVSSIPVIRGLADQRINVLVDGVDAVPACPNHMNTPLSYVDPSSIQSLQVYKSYKPVSIGLNSIGGAVVASTGQPIFAEEGKNLITGNVGGFYNTNNNNIGANLSVTAATDWISVNYTGSTSSANNYTAARAFHTGQPTYGTTRSGSVTNQTTAQILPGNMVGSTSYESTNQAVALALKSDKHTVQLKYSWQDIPYEGYVNQRMDLTGNQQNRYNLQYWGGYDWGKLEAQAYYEQLNHQMNFGPDKQFYYGNGTLGMPMNTNSNTSGVKVKGDINIAEASLLRTGAEWQRYYLNDWWPQSGTGGMSPYTFQNINGGLQQIASVFGEWEQRFTQDVKSELGVRYSLINASTGNVHGYNLNYAPSALAGGTAGSNTTTGYAMPTMGCATGTGMCNETTDAAAFNNGSRSATFNDVDVVLTTSYKHSEKQDMQLGLARQVRAPSLYELYSWSAWNMAAVMNNFVGDGNGYFGNPNLKPETAYTASAVYDLHTTEREWMVKASPFYSYVNNYIDAMQWTGNAAQGRQLSASAPVLNQFVTMQYVNQNANLAGIDLDGQMPIAKTDFGRFSAQGLFNWTYGKNLSTGYGLYNVMPVNGKLNLSHQYGGWDNQLQFIAVANKNNFLSVERNEIPTPGYFLTNLKASYSWSKVRVDAGINNLFNTFYYQPLGGAYLGQGRTMTMNPTAAQGGPQWGTAVPGMGISYYTAFNYKF